MKREDGRIRFEDTSELPPVAMSLTTTAFNRTGSWKYLEPFYQNLTPPCSSRCLTGNDVVGMLRLVEAEQWREAALAVMTRNPFPSITGRICPHPCETPCNRKAHGGGISVHAVERTLGDRKLADDIRPDPVPADGAAVAVLGSGPAGLSAAFFLRQYGHPVTIFEARAAAGGLLRHGIPAFRLPAGVVAAEVEWLEKCGVTIHTDVRLGSTEAEDAIRAFPAVVLALGLGATRPLGLPGEDHPAVLDGVRLLADVRGGKAPALHGRVGIIGGGNTAMDVARTVRRLGATPVVFYRRSRREMPAFADELEGALAEGVEIRFCTAPTAIAPRDSGLSLTVVTTTLGAKDAGGRAAPEPVAGSESVEALDFLVRATGEGEAGAELPHWLQAAPPADDGPAVFAAGDLPGQVGTSVSEAIQNGRLCAEAVVTRLRGAAPPPPPEPALAPGTLPASDAIAKYKDLNPAFFDKTPPVAVPMRAPAERVADTEEVEGPLAEADAVAEATRCFKCGTCTECGVCVHYCPDFAIRPLGPGKGFAVDLDYCKGCGVCVEECPRAGLHLRRSQ